MQKPWQVAESVYQVYKTKSEKQRLAESDSNIDAYDPKYSFSQQPESISKTFLDAMDVREEVFVKEQGVPLNNEFDCDDPRACHWVVYALSILPPKPSRKM